MNNDHHDHSNNRGLPFPHGFRIGTTIQNVFRNINHAFASNHDASGGQQRENDYISPPEHISSVEGGHDARPAHSTLVAPNPSISSTSSSADADMPPHSQLDLQREDVDEDSMPELRSVTDESDESDAGFATFNPVPPNRDILPVADDPESAWLDDEGDPPVEPIAGTRRARVDDDGDDARDRRHPSERVGGPHSLRDAAPQTANPQQLPRPAVGLFAPLFGLRRRGENIPPGHTHTGEATADPAPAGNNPIPGHVPRGAPIMTAGFTLTIPLFVPQTGNRAVPPPTGLQGGVPGMPGMDPAAREELLASFAAFFQEFQALDDAREDPERAKKLVSGLEVVPFGLVKRLERVGGAPGSHVGDSTTEGATSGCAICWDTLLDAEGDSFSGQQFSEGQAPRSGADHGFGGQNETHTEADGMDVDSSVSATHFEPGPSTSTTSAYEAAKIISLPCAHVFHASCLLPWFTRAKQATCPTCRFNIDPENLTYTPPPRPAFNRPPPVRPENAVPDPAPVDSHAEPEVPLEAPVHGARASDDAVPPINPVPQTHPATAAADPPTFPPTGQAGPPPPPPPNPGFNPFIIPGIPILSFPAIQIPLRQPATQAPGGDQGADVLTIGLDMFLGGPPNEEGGDPTENAGGADADDGEAATGTAGGNDTANPNGLAQDLQSLIEGLLRTTQNIIPQVINGQGPVPPPAPFPFPDRFPADGVPLQPQPQARPAPEMAGPQAVPPPAGGPRVFPFRPNMFRPTRPMPPSREPKTWTLPPAPGPSLRQRVEQRERDQGLRCSDTSCGVGPSDDDPDPDPSVSSTKQMFIHPLSSHDNHENDVRGSVCAHAFHPACLVSAERVAGWGVEDKTEPLVEVSCPVCRAVGCVTREEWESGVSAL